MVDVVGSPNDLFCDNVNDVLNDRNWVANCVSSSSPVKRMNHIDASDKGVFVVAHDIHKLCSSTHDDHSGQYTSLCSRIYTHWYEPLIFLYNYNTFHIRP